jgi:putative transposase
VHQTLKREAAKPASDNFLHQQERFDRFVGIYNTERPHRALKGANPGDLYKFAPEKVLTMSPE